MGMETRIRTGEAYVSGALTALDDGARMRLFYELLAEVVEASGLRAYLPQRVTDPGELDNLADKDPLKTKQLKDALAAWEKSL